MKFKTMIVSKLINAGNKCLSACSFKGIYQPDLRELKRAKKSNRSNIAKGMNAVLCFAMLFSLTVSVQAQENTPADNCESCYTQKMSREFTEITDVQYDENGEIIGFSVPISEEYYLENTQQSRVPVGTILTIASGVCFVVEVVYDVSCADLARYIGLQLIDGIYMWQNQPYNGEWSVYYGYVEGCEPMHSSGCFRAIYTKIG